MRTFLWIPACCLALGAGVVLWWAGHRPLTVAGASADEAVLAASPAPGAATGPVATPPGPTPGGATQPTVAAVVPAATDPSPAPVGATTVAAAAPAATTPAAPSAPAGRDVRQPSGPPPAGPGVPDPILGVDPHASVTLDDIPPGRFKNELLALRPEALGRALKWLAAFEYKGIAAKRLHASPDGGIFTSDPPAPPLAASPDAKATVGGSTSSEPPIAAAPIPVSNPPVYHSKPGSAYVIFLDFNGGVVTGTAWNSSVASFNCKPYSTDADSTTFSDAEQLDIQRLWQRVAEDYAPFDIDVTTEEPTSAQWSSNKVAWAMITPTTDANGVSLPHNGYGGIAYVGIFNTSSCRYYSPAWIALQGMEASSEATSHELGHNMGLSHDGTAAGGVEYHPGYAATASAPSWGPIMGAPYGKNVIQWSKGEYYDANQTQDDLAIIAARCAYRGDDFGDSMGKASPLPMADAVNVSGTGRVETSSDPDVFVFSTGTGTVTFGATTYKCAVGSWGSNLDIVLEIQDASGAVLATNNPLTTCNASLSYAASAGVYYLVVRPAAAGAPLSSSGYTVYGSLGTYTLTGTIPAVIPTGDGIWTNANGGSWPAPGNWDAYTVGSGTGKTANFATLDLAAHATVTLDGARTIGHLVFGDTAASHNWIVNTGSGGPLTLAVASGSPTVTVNNQTTTLATVLAGTSGLAKEGSGTLAVTTQATFTGTTTVNAGTLRLGVANTREGSLSGTPAIIVNPAATLDLPVLDAVGYTEGTQALVINGGTVTQSVTGVRSTLRNTVTMTGGTLTSTGVGDASGNYSFNRGAGITATSDAAGNAATVSAVQIAIQKTGDLPLQVTRGVAAPASDLTITSVIADNMSNSIGALVKTGDGILTLAGANTYRGATTVNAGTLRVTGSLASTAATTVAAGATLGGTGTLAGATTVNGTLAPGAGGIGTLRINNTLALTATATAAMRVNKSGTALTADKVAGVTTLSCGGTLRVTASGDALAPGDTFPLFSATTFTGSFATLDLPALPGPLVWDTSRLGTNGILAVIGTQTITFDPLPAKTPGDADFAPGATASSGLPVAYASSNPAVATIVGGMVHIVGAGTTTITASQAGDASWAPAADVERTLTVLTPLQAWRLANFGTTEDTGDAANAADPDGDQSSNFVEYALGLDPKVAGKVSAKAAIDVVEGYLRVSVARNPVASDAILVVEVSSDMVGWQGAEGTDVVTVENTAASFVVRDNTPVGDASTQRRFLRVRVEPAP